MPLTLRENQPEPDELLKGLDAIGRSLTDIQLEDELGYWRGISDIGGPLQMELGEVMKECVVYSVALCRIAAKWSSIKRFNRIPLVQAGVRSALASLAVSQLLRRQYDDRIRTANLGVENLDFALDFQFGRGTDAADVFAAVHHSRATVHEILEGYEPGGPETAWYEDELLVVNVHEGAQPRPHFEERYRSLTTDGQDFPKADFVTLTPQLKKAYLQPPLAG